MQQPLSFHEFQAGDQIGPSARHIRLIGNLQTEDPGVYPIESREEALMVHLTRTNDRLDNPSLGRLIVDQTNTSPEGLQDPTLPLRRRARCRGRWWSHWPDRR